MADVTILVANASRAKMYLSHNLGTDLALLDGPIEHLPSRVKRIELTSDKCGHYQKNSGQVQGAFAYTTDPKKAEAEKFAIELAHKLYQGCTNHGFERILLVAPAEFTHTLKQHCDATVLKRIYWVVAKDYTQRPELELKRLLSDCPRY